ncbi:phage holin family protein [uncultured Sphingomonas sp.]|uniref:phage holin family protein n=1 Tax=uncultured Sphingomonas sp. TaxID=158754 RepID=UPI0035C96078
MALRGIDDIAVDQNVSTLVTRVVSDARDLAAAEVALVKARIGERIAAYKSAAIFLAIAGVLALAALIALLVGLILTIATLTGPGYATAIVIVSTLVIAAVLGIIGKGHLAAPRPEALP